MQNNTDNIYNTEEESVGGDNIGCYVLEDEDRDEPLYSIEDDSGANETIPGSDKVSESTEADLSKRRILGSPLTFLLKTMATPVEGWKALKRARIPEDKLASGLFYPVLALAALSEFSGFIYETDFSVQTGVIRGLVTFITFFFSYFCVMLLSDVVIPKSCREKINTLYGKEYVMINMTTLAIFYIAFRIVPVMGPVFAFLPLWTIYMAVKGVKLFRVEDDVKVRVSMTLCTLIIGCPIFWNWVFTELLPLDKI